MAVWEYKVISSGKGGFATPALLESFLNQLGADQWEIIEFRGQPDNPLAFSGLARRPTQRDWTLEDAAAAAARAEADKLRLEFEAKFRSAAASQASAAAESGPVQTELGGEDNGLRRLRDTDHDADPDAPESEEEWDKLGAEEELPSFFEALRPHLRRNQRGPGFSVGIDYLAKKWDIPEADVIGALKECGLDVPEDEDTPPVYVDYDGDLYWVNVNRRGELWLNTKEKSRPAFRTVQAKRVEPEEKPAEAEGAPAREPSRERENRPSSQEPLPSGPALLERIRPQMRRNRRDSGASGSVSFLSRALRCTDTALSEEFASLGLKAPEAPGEQPVTVDIGEETWWLNRDQRGGVWINVGERRVPGMESSEPTASAPATQAPTGQVLAAVRLLLAETKTGSFSATVEHVASEIGKPVVELLEALTAAGLRIPDKPREKPVFAEHGGEIFWINRNAKGGLWINAKASKYSNEEDGSAKGRRGRGRKKADSEDSVAEPGLEGTSEAAPSAAEAPPAAS